MSAQRDFAAEAADHPERRYAYDFDSVLRRYMMRTFAPMIPAGQGLELGCYEGDFTAHLVPVFPDLTVVEAAESLIEKTRTKFPPTLRFVHGTLEGVELPENTYDAVFLTHVLEHIDDPALVLSRIGRWLSPRGRLFVAVPNANAASRQIAVRMGLIPFNAAVTQGEFAQGHRRTYSLDTLENDARSGGLRIARRGGIFFKPLANFQFDRLMKTDILSAEYLEGCFLLGEQYPDLCASIYLICEKGAS